ncbi:hypothetical protein DOY81_003185 [Sarcophaga bullata]|nr:hypothetical protein DOY81_003185 [Sarcophaga bullata]
MSTRKSTQASPTVHGSKTENASISACSTANTTKPLAEKAEMGASVSSNGNNTNVANASETKTVEQSQKHNQETKSFQQRVTRNSPLLLASPGGGGITIKKEPIEPTDHQTNSESEEGSVNNLVTKKQVIRGRKSLKEHKETKEQEDKEKEEKQEETEDKEKDKELKEEANVHKNQEEHKDIKEKDSTASSPAQAPASIASNRLTRKSVANQESANTRITRQRQSSGASVRSETPPARARSGRLIGRAKMPVPMIESTLVTKRKRSVDVDNAVANNRKNSIDEPGPKYIKIEIKDPEIDNEEMLTSSQTTNASTESTEEHPIKIKQEILDESENEMNTNTEVSTTAPNTSTSTTTNAARGKGRWAPRKSTGTTSSASTSNNSPSTRATRQTKQSSPVRISNASTGTETTKRRRMGSQTRSLLKTSVSNSKNQPLNGQDEDDSKDSIASSTNTDDIVLALIKSEKISMELDDDNTNDTKDLPADNKNAEGPKATTAGVEENNDLPPPLVVDTEVTQTVGNANREPIESSTNLTPVAASCSSITSSGSEKAASLSPSDLVSEGVSEISVKQFYKKPKFLENNLGIEEDPKLGNIVQKVAGLESVSTSDTTTTTTTTSVPIVATDTVTVATVKTTTSNAATDTRLLDDSFSNESLKEGSLRFEESTDDKKLLSQDDCDSSGGNLTPLLVVEDDDEDLNEVLEVKDDEEEEIDVISKKKSLRKSSNPIEENVNDAKMKVIDVDDVDDEDQDQDDELTLEESETISMDNNASVNDEVVAEIEDNVNEENTNELDDITDLADVVVAPAMQPGSEKAIIQIENNETSANSSCEIIENMDEIIESKPSDNHTPERIVESVITLESTGNEDNDVLAKIDAELRKIDERKREKLLSNEDACDVVKVNKEDVIKSVHDVRSDNKLISELDTKNITKKEHATVDDDTMKIKTDEGQRLIVSDNIKLLDDKDKIEVIAENPIGYTPIDNKSDIEKIILKTSAVTEIDENSLNPITFSAENLHNKSGVAIVKDDDTTSMKSGQSTTSWVTLDLDHDEDEALRKKELHLQNLGLVTHKAAEKRRLEVIQSSAANVEASKVATQQHHNKRNGKNSSHAASTHHEYTGTLKTIIKINRNSTGGSTSGGNGRKCQNIAVGSSTSKEQQQQHRRQSLKMTFQKGRARAHGTSNNDRSQQDREGHVEDNYYTIQNETEGALQKFNSFPTTSSTSLTRYALTHTNNNNNNINNCNNIVKSSSATYARKSYNYRTNHQHHSHSASTNNTAHIFDMESHDHPTGVSTKKDEKEEILIPEKASSFKFHPGRLCEDQCFYCSGKFGLYDTPCHVGQIKSMERQQKILANEEKLTVDNCLCDACFRHVDRRANVPSYKKRLSAPGNLESMSSSNSLKSADNQHYDDATQNAEADGSEINTSRKCLVPECANPAAHSLRRKCIRKSVKKFLLNFEIPAGAASVWLCQTHYDTVIQCSGCVLCKRRLGKNHMYHITSDTDRLEKALCEMGIPVQLGIGTAVCKLCRYFANLLMKPPDSSKSQKAEFVKNYRKRLLQFHNIHDGSNDASEADEDDNSNSASHHDSNEVQEKTSHCNSVLEENIETTPGQKDTSKSKNFVDSADNSLATNNNANNAADETTPSNVMERDLETTAISTDSSNSSMSNTTTNSPNEMSKLKAILQSNISTEKQPSADISNVLRANPNISMRELFPGEEDLGLHFKAPFGSNNSQRTPEGWTRVSTFLQYDEPTRRLWEELQKPYGNQSSFLRHLILLEKYYRNGDLVLSASASNNASVYTQTVKQRLTSYDKGHCGGLHIGTGTPKENTNATKTKETDSQIPTFVINEDDDEDSEDQDVEMTQVDKSSKSSSFTMQKNESPTGQNKPQLQRSRSLSVDKLTKQLSSNAVTITARPKDSSTSASNNKQRATPSPQKSLLKDNLLSTANNSSGGSNSANLAAANAAAAVALAASTASAANSGGPSNSRSILKCNLLGINKSVEILPINSTASTTVSKSSNNSSAPAPPAPPPAPIPPLPETKQQKILDVANKLLGNHMEATTVNQNKNQTSLLSSPPELVSLQRRSAGQTATGSVAANPNSSQQSNNLNKRPQLLVKQGTSRPPPNVVILPDTLTPQERLQSKTWRPTLMPVEENQNLLNKNGPLYQTADGRRLPALVQVQSGGKPFLISIFDYNRMCILRREKLMRDQMLKATKKRQEAKQQQHAQAQQQQIQQHQLQAQQAQQQQQLQKANLQNMNKTYQPQTVSTQRQQQQQVAQQQLLQLQLLHQQALYKAAAAANNSNSQSTVRYQPIAPKPATSNIATMPPLQTPITTNANFTAPMMPLLANAITNAANTGNVNPASSSLNNTSWLWNNFPDANQLLPNGGGTPVGQNVPKLPQLLAKPNNAATALANANNAMKQHQQQQQQQQQQFLLSKIPKSLTVIPQHKLMNNPANAVSGNSSNTMKE